LLRYFSESFTQSSAIVLLVYILTG